MSFPVEPDFVVIKLGDGATPTEVFTVMCGMENINLNQTANTTDRFRRDCAKPAALPKRKVRTTSTQWDVTGSGVINTAEFARFKAALGYSRNYRLEFGRYDVAQPDTGVIIGTYAGPAVMTANNISMSDGEGGADITLAGENDIVWTPAS